MYRFNLAQGFMYTGFFTGGEKYHNTPIDRTDPWEGGEGAGGACAPPFRTENYIQQYTTVCKVVSLRLSQAKFKVVGHPLA